MISSLDHLVLTVNDIDKTVFFYTHILGMTKEEYGQGRIALKFGTQKINLHEYGKEFEPKASQPTPGSADICFITSIPLEEAFCKLQEHGVEIIGGIVSRTGANGANGAMKSIYFRDPDGNLIEMSTYPNTK